MQITQKEIVLHVQMHIYTHFQFTAKQYKKKEEQIQAVPHRRQCSADSNWDFNHHAYQHTVFIQFNFHVVFW